MPSTTLGLGIGSWTSRLGLRTRRPEPDDVCFSDEDDFFPQKQQQQTRTFRSEARRALQIRGQRSAIYWEWNRWRA